MHQSLRVLAAVLLTATTTATAAAQDIAERIRIYGSLNAAYAKADNFPAGGITRRGTSDFRVIALQVRAQVSENGQLVTQLVSRRTGASVLNEATPGIYPAWAYYEHRFDGGLRVKAGRTPLPRGIFNEIRYIGTLLPFYRVGGVVYGETLEYLDGVTVARGFPLFGKTGEVTVFGGGFDLNAILPDRAGTPQLLRIRLENTAGAQLWLPTPLPGVRLGGFAARYEAADRRPQMTYLGSIDGRWSRAFAQAEWTQFLDDAPKATDRTNYRAWYAQVGFKPTEKITVAGTYEQATNEFNFPAPISNSRVDLDLAKVLGAGVVWAPSSSVAVKVEARRQEGYSWDVGVPTFVPPTRPPFTMGVAPASKGNFLIASIAATF